MIYLMSKNATDVISIDGVLVGGILIDLQKKVEYILSTYNNILSHFMDRTSFPEDNTEDNHDLDGRNSSIPISESIDTSSNEKLEQGEDRMIDDFRDSRNMSHFLRENLDNNVVAGDNTENNILDRLLHCYGLKGIDDNRAFCMADLERHHTIDRILDIRQELNVFYAPCKAKIYLERDHMSLRRCITILKQVVRIYKKTLLSRERNIQGKKTVFYQIIKQDSLEDLRQMTKHDGQQWVCF